MRAGIGLAAGLVMALAAPAAARADEPAFPLHPAAVLDPATFTHAARVLARPSAAGVSRIRVSPAVLSVAQDDLGDLRVVDGASRQWPFVLVRDGGHDKLPLRVESVKVAAGRSQWRLVPAVTPVVLDRVTLRVERERFDRPYHLLSELPGDRAAELSGGRLSRAAGGPRDLGLEIPRSRVTALALVVDDGDEAPLPLAEAIADAPVAELRLVAPAGEYTLLAGDPETRAPRYEVAGARDQVLAAKAGEAEVGPPAPNPLYRPRLPHGEERDRIALWVVMAVAVGALGALTLRLARKEKPPSEPRA